MVSSKKASSRKKLLSSSRPRPHSLPTNQSTRSIPATKPTSSSLSSKQTRTLIRSHHTLQKQLSAAQAANDTSLAAKIQAAIDAQGGLARYQQASIQGQSSERGGDSSRVLVQWVEELRREHSWGKGEGKTSSDSEVDGEIKDEGKGKGEAKSKSAAKLKPPLPLRLLEVGALSVTNACARSGLFELTRIDLHSQHAAIATQDFMQRPEPASAAERETDGFDVVSLSLVVNYVGDAPGRGEMLRKVGRFLRSARGGQEDGRDEVEGTVVDGDGDGDGDGDEDGWQEKATPSLFLVLPAPCVLNSRYLDEERLESMMRVLGYEMVRKKLSSKLVYYLWRYLGENEKVKIKFAKTELRKGRDRNNFAIVLQYINYYAFVN